MKLTLLAGYSVVIVSKTKKGSNYKSFLCYVREKVKVDVESEKKNIYRNRYLHKALNI